MSTRILIIEDDDTTQALLRSVMTGEYIEFVQSSDGEDALVRIRAEQFAAIILDLILPSVDGFEILRYLRENNPQTLRRVVVLSGAPESRMKTCEELLMVHSVIRKPPDLQRLTTDVLDCIVKAAAEQAGGESSEQAS